MQDNNVSNYIQKVLENMPSGWIKTTTHRLDIYDEKQAKTQFLNEFENLYKNNIADTTTLNALPTAYDYIRLGHPLSCVLEWTIAKLNHTKPENVISFSSKTTPILAILRKNLLENKNTQINYIGKLPSYFDANLLRNVYGYHFDLHQVENPSEITSFDGSTIFISEVAEIATIVNNTNVDFFVQLIPELGSIILVKGSKNEPYISEIQHVRRRETIAMTPANCVMMLQSIVGEPLDHTKTDTKANKKSVEETIAQITLSPTKALLGSSGLSIQYAIMMGLVDYAYEHHKGKAIKFIVPPNCYGGTNDQARRVAACLENVEIVDLLVDSGNDMVKSIDTILEAVASEDAIPYIIAEIPTNPRVEVPNLIDLKIVLSKQRKTKSGENAINPVFILDQTFCPDYHFLGENNILSSVKTISFASGSKFPSGGLCTAGYCVGNKKTEPLMDKIAIHLSLCDNEATALQYEILAQQMPSMNQRIIEAYKNTREFVNYIHEVLPTAKINFVSDELAEQGFKPSVFSLDLPTKGNSAEEKETYKRALNLKLINLMITEIPEESKFCVSYGQLKGVYWTVPATSTQGTTKEGDKDYIVRASLSANMDMEKYKKVFLDFVKSL